MHRVLAAALLAMAAVPGRAADMERLVWMAGHWIEADDSRLSEEIWLAPRGGLMLGMSRTGKPGARGQFEFARIEPGLDGRIGFHAQPGGAPASVFWSVEQGAQSITFANAAHDYPQRIRYWREGDRLMAEISLADGSRPVRWRYSRVP